MVFYKHNSPSICFKWAFLRGCLRQKNKSDTQGANKMFHYLKLIELIAGKGHKLCVIISMIDTVPLALNVKQVRELLNCSLSQIYRLVKEKRLVPLNLCRRNRLFSYADVVALSKNK